MPIPVKQIAALAVLVSLAACSRPQEGFVLPEGDAENGQQLFVSFECTACHQIRGLDLPPPSAQGPVTVRLGGQVTQVRRYDELVTSVINPSHRLVLGKRKEDVSTDGESLMPIFNDVMTVSELIDIVAFLESRYERVQRPGYRYPVYTYD